MNMMRNKNFLFFIIIYLSIISSIIFANKKNNDPSWVYLKNAENLKEKGEYSSAIIEARKARMKYIDEQINKYYKEIREIHRDKIEYELKKMVDKKREQLLLNDNYPQYHELMGDLYSLTNFISESEKEYKLALSQKKYFAYPDKNIEIKYKIANIYSKKNNYELQDIVYREITKEYFNKKNVSYWDRIKINIKNDLSLSHVFRIYRIEGIEYLEALYKIGRRSAMLRRKNEESLFYLVNAAIVWMTYYSELIRKYHFEFQYSNPTDFINFISKDRLYEYETEEYIIDEIFFFIGYVFHIENEYEMRDYYFKLSLIFSKGTKREEEMKKRIEYFKIDKDYILTFEEIK